MKPSASSRLARAYRHRGDLHQAALAWLRHGSVDDNSSELAAIVDRFVTSNLLRNLVESRNQPLTLQIHGLWWALIASSLGHPVPLPDYPDRKVYPAWEPLGLSFRSYADDVTRQRSIGFSPAVGLLLATADAAVPLAKLSPILSFLETKVRPEAGTVAPLLIATGAVWVEKGISAMAIVECWKALADQGVDDRDVAALWYDPAVDTRQKPSSLTIQLSVLPKVVAWFRLREPALVPRILRITRDFLRLSGLANSRHLATVLKTFQEYWYVDLAEWVEEGAKLIRLHGDEHIKVSEWFTRESEGSRQMWQKLDSAIHFAQAQEMTSHFLTGLLERSLPLVADAQGGFWTDGQRIGLPDHYGPTRDREQNQMLWRHSCAHEAAHLMYGSFSTDVPRFKKTLAMVKHQFPDLYEERRHDIPRLQKDLVEMCQALLEIMGLDRRRAETVDFFASDSPSSLTLMLHFPRVLEAKLLHNVFEDGRIERQLYRDFGGLAKEREAKERLEATLRQNQTTENRAQELALAVFLKVLYHQQPPDEQSWNEDWHRIQQCIDAFEAREDTDVWDSWMVTAQVCAVIDESFRRADEREWDLSRDVPFRLIVESVKLLLEGRLGRRPSASEEVRQATEVLADHLPSDLAWLLGELMTDQEQGAQRDASLRFGTLPEGTEPGSRKGFDDQVGMNPHQIKAYPEWSREKSDYLKDYCLVGDCPPSVLTGQRPVDLSSRMGLSSASLQRAFQRMRPEAWTERRGEEDGDEWDTDALFDGIMEFKAGNMWEQDFYLHRHKKNRDVVTALLLDCSSSTLETDAKGKSLFQCEQEAAYLLGQALSALGDRFALFGAYDYGPRSNVVVTIKDLETPWDRRVIERLGALEPPERGFSRMAPALRHLQAILSQCEARTKVIFFITDGLPFYVQALVDRQETSDQVMRDGVPLKLSAPVKVLSITSCPDSWARDDLRKVVEEAQGVGIHLFGVNLNADAQPFMESVFGRHALYVPEAHLLAPRLLEVFRRVTL